MKLIHTLIIFLLSIGFCYAQDLSKWETMNTGTSKNINDMYFHTTELGYIVGDNYLFKKTSDGGKTWVDLTPPNFGERPGNNGNISSIAFYQTTFFGRSDSGLYLTWEHGNQGIFTADEGVNYEPYNYMDSNNLCHIQGFSPLPLNRGNAYVSLYTFGQNCNGKAAFENFHDGPFSIHVADSVNSVDSSMFTAVDADSFATIFGSTDGYLRRYRYVTAPPDSIYLDSFGVSAVAYAGSHVWYASTGTGFDNMYVSRDSGKTFNIDATFPPSFHYPYIYDMDFTSPDRGLVAASSNVRNGVIIVKVLDRWYFVNAIKPIHSVKLFESNLAYAAGDEGLFMKSGQGDTTLSIVEQQMKRFQVYPNPTTGIVFLTGLDDVETTSIQLLDVHGSLVSYYPGDQDEINLEGLSKGIYYLRVNVLGGSAMRKVVKVE